ncbi:protein takeout [Hetaerina americana]|uniref:protein takeout n=1 Tax=Hetaerina americana TaxID=62018 RepID=UPI003A7F4597
MESGTSRKKLATLLLVFVLQNVCAVGDEIPPYVKQCRVADPHLIECLTSALHHLRPYLAKGIPEIEMPSVEPFRMDELSLSLTSGPNGYRIVLKDLDIYGASNFTVGNLRLGSGERPFQATVNFPTLRIHAKYTSSGVLIILPASGNGSFHADFGDVDALVRGKVVSETRGGKEYLRVDTLDLDINIKRVRMQVKKIFNNNRILTEATNLFLRENGHEVIKVMTPQLRKKLTVLFQSIANQLLKNVPLDVFLVQGE